LNVTVPFGSDDFDVTLYDTAPTGGVIPSTAHVLGTATVTQTITLGVPATVSLFVQGTISGLGTIAPLLTFPADGNTYASSVVFNPVDFSNQPITAGTNDPFSNPITVTLTETGGSGLTQLTVNGAPVGTSATLTQSNQTLGVSYNGGGTPGYFASVTLAATGVTTASFKVAPMYVTSASPYFTNAVLNFTGSGQSAVVNVSEAAGTNAYGTLLAGTCSANLTIGSVTGSGATGSFTVMSGTNAVSGGCGITITDSANTAVTVNYKNTETLAGVTIGGITEYPTPISAPNLIVTGADGNLYVAGSTAATIWVYNTAGAEAGWYNVLVPSQLPVSMAAGPNGFVWYVSATSQAWYNTSLSACCTIVSPTGASKLNGIALGPDGNMWMTDGTTNQVFDVAPFGGLVATYNLSVSPTLIAASQGVSGAAWIVSPSAGASTLVQQIAGANPIDITIPGANVGPAAMTVDTSGNVWIAEQTENEIDMYNGASWAQYPIGQGDGPAGITVGADGNIWFTAPGTNSIGAFNVTTHAFTHYPIPTSSANPSAITLGSDGRVWFTETAVGKMGAITP